MRQGYWSISRMPPKVPFMTHLKQAPTRSSPPILLAACIAHPAQPDGRTTEALAEQGGVAQICLYKGFINEDAEKASLSDAIRHIDHIVDLIGINHVGIGSDFDGDGELIGCRASNELINITMRLLKRRIYRKMILLKIWGGNLLRVMNKAQSAPDNSL